MNDPYIPIRVGTRFSCDGSLWEVIEIDSKYGGHVTAANGAYVRTMTMSELLHDIRHRFIPLDPQRGPDLLDETCALILAQLSAKELDEVRVRAGHVREVLTGYKSGSAELARPNEPEPQYDATLPLEARYAAKAAELRVNVRSVKRWVAEFRKYGEAGLKVSRKYKEPQVDPRWATEALAVMASYVTASRPSRSAVIRKTNRNCTERFGDGEVPTPSRATAYRTLSLLDRQQSLFRLSTQRIRDIDQRPARPYRNLPCTRPGEYVYLDTTPLDVFAMDPVTLRWLPVHLTVAMDRYTRCIIALVLTAGDAKAVDVASVLYECLRPRPAPEHWPAYASWPEHGVPRCILIDPAAIEEPRSARRKKTERRASGPAVVPETIIVDHGKIYMAEHVSSACARLWISIQPARIREPRDKAPVERFFRTIREDLVQHLDGYKGPDVYSRGLDVENRAFYYVDELEQIIREWVATVYHHRPHEGLIEPGMPNAAFTPTQMYHHGLARGGYIEAPRDPYLALEFLKVVPRTIQQYGVDVNNRVYRGEIATKLYGKPSPYTGKFKDKWPVYLDPYDIRRAYMRDPEDHSWHTLTWQYAEMLDQPLAEEALEFARKLAAKRHRFVDDKLALEELLTRWEVGSKSTGAERRLAINMARQDRRLLSADVPKTDAETAAALASTAHAVRQQQQPSPEPETGDDDLPEELNNDYTGGEDDDFYNGAFEDA